MELYLIKHLLDQSIEDKKLYCFYEYNESSFYCGFVLSYNSDCIQIQHYNKIGEKDGIIDLSYDNICRISINGSYIRSIQHMVEYQEDFKRLNNSLDFRLNTNSQGHLSLLQECLNNRNIIVSIGISSDKYIGFVDDIISSTHIIFTEIDNEGFEIDTTIHRIDDLKIVGVNEKEARKYLFLYNWRKSKK